jgi:hypothetical protein
MAERAAILAMRQSDRRTGAQSLGSARRGANGEDPITPAAGELVRALPSTQNLSTKCTALIGDAIPHGIGK